MCWILLRWFKFQGKKKYAEGLKRHKSNFHFLIIFIYLSFTVFLFISIALCLSLIHTLLLEGIQDYTRFKPDGHISASTWISAPPHVSVILGDACLSFHIVDGIFSARYSVLQLRDFSLWKVNLCWHARGWSYVLIVVNGQTILPRAS